MEVARSLQACARSALNNTAKCKRSQVSAFVIVIPACIVLVSGVGLAHSEPAVASILIAVGAVAIVAIAAAASAMREIFALALYCYAVDGEVRVFAPGDLDQPFSGRGKRATNRD